MRNLQTIYVTLALCGLALVTLADSPPELGSVTAEFQLFNAARNSGVTLVVTKSEDAYTVQHTPGIFLIGPSGELIDTFAMNTPSSDIAAAMQ
jgi:cytochrome oxidase Cu insertion factor (SCO1/SenC/PrrC family)